MILLLSEDGDKTTDIVVDWLNYYKSDFLVLKSKNLYNNIPTNIKVSDNLEINSFFSNINIAWCRRWNIDNYENINNNIKVHIVSELNHFSTIFFESLKNIVWINHPNFTKIKKVDQLSIAKKSGLNIPDTIITNNRIELQNFCKHKGRIITKPIESSSEIILDNDLYVSYTNILDDTIIEKLPAFFAPSLFQEEINKEFEIRVFYFNEMIYSMAIFSQLDSKTMIDQKKYNMEKPNRKVAYSIPKLLHRSILRFMKNSNLQTGVLDIIKSKNNKYYFFEVNPVGQFNDISIICNYNLEKI
ncbi:MAG: hypothetical protein ACQESN_11810, partial [Thermotogota bacterium]